MYSNMNADHQESVSTNQQERQRQIDLNSKLISGCFRAMHIIKKFIGPEKIKGVVDSRNATSRMASMGAFCGSQDHYLFVASSMDCPIIPHRLSSNEALLFVYLF